MDLDARPIVRWPGGKSEHHTKHGDKLPSAIGATGYREPFFGGGALFFRRYRAIRPAVLSDVNPHLVALYRTIRDNPGALIKALSMYAYTEDQYYAIRDRFNDAPCAPIVLRAAWFLYLNKCGANGLCRYNQAGEFNVPFGRTADGEAPLICDVDNILATSAALQRTDFRCGDFMVGLEDIREDEVIILDPPYFDVATPVDTPKVKSFTAYTAQGFSYEDQVRLADKLVELDAAGADFALTNADTPEARLLYARWDIATVQIQRSVSFMGKVGPGEVREKTREKAAEIIVRNRPSSRLAC